MPGIAGVVSSEIGLDLDRVIASMLQAMEHREGMAAVIWRSGTANCVLGATTLGATGPTRQPLFDESRKFALVLDGEFYAEGDSSSQLEELTSACLAPESGGLVRLQGAFAVAGFDETKNRLVLATDKHGQKPLYYTIYSGGIAFASEVKALPRLKQVSRERDDQAFADCYRYGFVLGDKTLFRDIRLLPPASTLVYDVSSGRVAVATYWQLLDIFRSGETGGTRGLADAVEAFVAGVARRTAEPHLLGVSLSGGLDSRAVLAAMGERSRGVHTYTLGLANCQDQHIAARLAELCGTKHEFLEITPADLGDFESLARTLVFLSDGLYHPHESTEKRALDYFRAAPFRIVLRGHGGEIAKAALAYPVQATSELAVQTQHEEGVNFIYRQANLGIRGLDPTLIFSPSFAAAMEDGARRSLEEALAPARGRMNNADLCIYFYITQLIRRQVQASLAVFRSQVEIRLPYLDEDFLERLLRLPVQERFAGEVQVAIVKRCAPNLIAVTNSNTGAPLDAGKLRLFLTDKVNAVMKRAGLSGFRHYTEFQKWQREQFRQSIEQIIFCDRTLARGLYNPEGLRAVFLEHVSGRQNCGHLFGTIVALELWHRLFVDESP